MPYRVIVIFHKKGEKEEVSEFTYMRIIKTNKYAAFGDTKPFSLDEATLDALTKKLAAIHNELIDLRSNPNARQLGPQIQSISSQVESLRYEFATLAGRAKGHAAMNPAAPNPKVTPPAQPNEAAGNDL